MDGIMARGASHKHHKPEHGTVRHQTETRHNRPRTPIHTHSSTMQEIPSAAGLGNFCPYYKRPNKRQHLLKLRHQKSVTHLKGGSRSGSWKPLLQTTTFGSSCPACPYRLLLFGAQFRPGLTDYYLVGGGYGVLHYLAQRTPWPPRHPGARHSPLQPNSSGRPAVWRRGFRRSGGREPPCRSLWKLPLRPPANLPSRLPCAR